MKEYLNKRGITDELIKEYGFVENKDKSISFNIEDLNGNILGKKVRANPAIVKPERKYLNPKGVGNQLFNWHRVKDSKKIVIVEGEFDAILLQGLGIPAITATVGASGKKYNEEWLQLLQDKLIYIWFDNDKAGHEGMANLYKQFPNAKFVLSVEGEKTDATDIYTEFGEDKIKELLNSAETIKEPYTSKFGIKFTLEVKKQIQQLQVDSDSEFHKRLEEAKQVPINGLLNLDSQGKVLCPFHNEKTKSFSWDKINNTFKCFGCGVQGDSVNFVKEQHDFSTIEAINYLIGKPEVKKSPEVVKAVQEIGDTASAEEAVLSSILKNNDSYFLVEGELQSHHFYSDKNRYIFESMENLFSNKDMVDITTLTAELDKQGNISTIGGSEWLKKLMYNSSSYKGISSYAKLIIEKNTKRKLIEISGEIMDKAVGSEDSIDVIEFAETKIEAISSEGIKDDSTVDISTANTLAIEKLKQFMNSGEDIKGIKTGFKELDEEIDGLKKGNLIILGARPGVGKTAIALNIALNAASEEKKKVVFFSMEMTKEELSERLLSSIAGVSTRKIKDDNEGRERFEKIQQADTQLKQVKLYLNDTAAMQVAAIKAISRKLKRKGGLDFIVIDYLQLMSASKEYSKSNNENIKVASISKGLKQLAKELDIPVLALSQLNREGGKNGVEPNLTNLRDSGSLEQDADIVLFLHRARVEGTKEQLEDSGKLLIAKNRHGRTGEIYVKLNGETYSFEEIPELPQGQTYQPASKDDDFEF